MPLTIIGLTGPMGCGKGELVKMLERRGFRYITLSSMVREEARRRGIAEERENLMEVGNSMRSAEGAGALAKRALEKIKASHEDQWVVDGIRNPAEINRLKEENNTTIVGVFTKKELLVDRIVKRGRESDAKERKEILKKIEREWGKGEPRDGQQVERCMKKADIVIQNEGTLSELREIFFSHFPNMKKLHTTSVRPSKDEYYIDLSKSVCQRSTCSKVAIGAVIIRDDQVVATGYCGAPRGTKDSLEHGFCLRKKLGIPSGHRYEMCRSVHAEQNAIINAARSGTSLLGGDMYIYGHIRDSKEPIDAFPCFICKKMLINCGLKRVICSLKGGGKQIFSVEDWTRKWREQDIIDDEHQYGLKSSAS